jgi:hypothetical protein
LDVIPGLTRDPWIAGQARNDKGKRFDILMGEQQ